MINLGEIAAERGLIIKRPPVPGKITRYPTVDRPGSLNGVVLLRHDGSGWAQNWAVDPEPVQFGVRAEIDPLALAKMAAARRVETEQAEADAARRCLSDWRQAGAVAPNHPYVVKKGIQPYGARQSGAWLIIPYSIAGTITTLQRIAPDGTKRFAKGGRKRGAYCAIGGRPNGQITIAEGWATGCSVHEATGLPVAIAGDAGNLEPVAIALRRAFPDAEIIVVGDHDMVGIARGRGAAVGARLIMPVRPGDDFNDLASREGLDAVVDLVGGHA